MGVAAELGSCGSLQQVHCWGVGRGSTTWTTAPCCCQPLCHNTVGGKRLLAMLLAWFCQAGSASLPFLKGQCEVPQ